MSSDVNLLRIQIGPGDLRIRENLVDLIRNILNKLFTVENIDQASITEIFHIQGIGAAKVRQIKAALEVSKKMSSKTFKKNNWNKHVIVNIIIGRNGFFSFADEGLL